MAKKAKATAEPTTDPVATAEPITDPVATAEPTARAKPGKGYKPCPKCFSVKTPVRTKKCVDCEYEFPITIKSESKVSVKPSQDIPKEGLVLKTLLLSEKSRLEEILNNTNQLQSRLTKITELLSTME